jgi:hypothetical protein
MGWLTLRIFLKKGPPYKMVHFKPEEHPYKPHPSYPLRHGLLKSGEIDWPFWCRQKTWTFDQAIRLLDYTRTGEDGFVALPWDLYQRISSGLEKAFKAGAATTSLKADQIQTLVLFSKTLWYTLRLLWSGLITIT